jgi:hypothetical protein
MRFVVYSRRATEYLSPVLALILGFGLLASAPVPAGTTPFVVDSVEIVRHNAMDGSRVLTRSDSLVYSWLQDYLHWKTTDATVRRYLISGLGDTLSPLRLAETGRLLRSQRFFADAAVSERVDTSGRHVLHAETWDQWSLSVPLSISRAGGQLSWIVGLSEANLVGTGQQVGGYYSSTSLRDSWYATYGNNAFVGQGGRLAFVAASNSDGFSGSFEVGKPVRSRYDHWGLLLSGARSSYERIYYVPTELRERLPGASRWPDSEAQWITQPHSLTENLRAAFTLAAGEDVQVLASAIGEWYEDTVGRSYYDTALAIPRSMTGWYAASAQGSSRKDSRYGLSLQVKRIHYWSARNFQNLKWTEDVALGWNLESTVLMNAETDGYRRSALWLRQAGSWSGLPVKDWYLAASGGAQWFAGGETGPDQGTATGRLEARWFPAPGWQTLTSSSLDAAFYQSEALTQYTLGEDNGLPGYAARSLAGKSRWVFAAEERWTPPLEAFTVVPALAVFAGAGQVSSTPQPWEGSGWRAGVGFGLRFGMSRSIDGVVNHLSFSRPVGLASPFSWRAWMISFGSKQSL